MPLPIIVLEEPGPLGSELARILNFRGFQATAAADLDDALRQVHEAAPDKVGVFISSTVAAAAGTAFDRLLQSEPRPVVRLICTRPLTCPMHPGLPCPGLDCLEKPGDFATADLKERVRQMLLGGKPCHSHCGGCRDAVVECRPGRNSATAPTWLPVFQANES